MPKNNSRAQREYRRKSAEERQRKYDALTVKERIALAASRPGKSDREITRLGIASGIYPASVREDRKAFWDLVKKNMLVDIQDAS